MCVLCCTNTPTYIAEPNTALNMHLVMIKIHPRSHPCDSVNVTAFSAWLDYNVTYKLFPSPPPFAKALTRMRPGLSFSSASSERSLRSWSCLFDPSPCKTRRAWRVCSSPCTGFCPWNEGPHTFLRHRHTRLCCADQNGDDSYR